MQYCSRFADLWFVCLMRPIASHLRREIEALATRRCSLIRLRRASVIEALNFYIERIWIAMRKLLIDTSPIWTLKYSRKMNKSLQREGYYTLQDFFKLCFATQIQKTDLSNKSICAGFLCAIIASSEQSKQASKYLYIGNLPPASKEAIIEAPIAYVQSTKARVTQDILEGCESFMMQFYSRILHFAWVLETEKNEGVTLKKIYEEFDEVCSHDTLEIVFQNLLQDKYLVKNSEIGSYILNLQPARFYLEQMKEEVKTEAEKEELQTVFDWMKIGHMGDVAEKEGIKVSAVSSRIRYTLFNLPLCLESRYAAAARKYDLTPAQIRKLGVNRPILHLLARNQRNQFSSQIGNTIIQDKFSGELKVKTQVQED